MYETSQLAALCKKWSDSRQRIQAVPDDQLELVSKAWNVLDLSIKVGIGQRVIFS